MDYVELYNARSNIPEFERLRLADNPEGTNAFVIPAGVV
jgi:hypothetical protein